MRWFRSILPVIALNLNRQKQNSSTHSSHLWTGFTSANFEEYSVGRSLSAGLKHRFLPLDRGHCVLRYALQ
jgi:hypothetical protein